MNGLMMDFQLALPAILRRAEQLFAAKEIVSRQPDQSLHRYTYAEMARRTKQLSLALTRAGIQAGDRVGTLCWNHSQHLECYFGIPLAGGVLHTLNLRLHPNDIGYIAHHAADRLVIVDHSLLPLYQQFAAQTKIEKVIVVCSPGAELPAGMISFEEFIGSEDPAAFTYPEIDERQAAAMCYTSGTTGQPKGVLYSHRSITLHALGAALADGLGLCERDTCLPVVPMFHANAWGMPFACTMVGSKQVFPGPHLDPASLLDLLASERVTMTAGVPTIWLGILQLLDAEPERWDLQKLRAMVVGGSAAPPAMIRGFRERHGLEVVHAWGMTELSPIGTVSNLPGRLEEASAEAQLASRARQGAPVPLVEVRARNEEGLIPWDDTAMGELECRGPWIASSYYESPEGAKSFTADGWFRTGDIVSIAPDGNLQLQDRAKDVIKSGGEWISSVALENALMGHPQVAEAAVIPVAHPKWAERPLALCVLKPGAEVTATDLKEFLEPQFAKWWLPDAIEFIDEIPRTSAGKFLKSALRERYSDYYTGPLP